MILILSRINKYQEKCRKTDRCLKKNIIQTEREYPPVGFIQFANSQILINLYVFNLQPYELINANYYAVV